MKRTWLVIFVLCALAAKGGTYYMKNGATDFSVSDGYTTDGTNPASSVPGSGDEVIVPAGTFAIDVTSASFTTLSGVKRVRPSEGAVLEFTAGEGVTGTFNAPINWNADEGNYEASGVKCYGKIVKKGVGALTLESSGNTKGWGVIQDYFTAIDIQAGTLKLPQHAVGNMFFGDLTMSANSTLVTCGNIDNGSTQIYTYLRSLNGDGVITNETGRSSGQSLSPYARDVVQDNVFRGRICYPAKLWLEGRLTQFGNSTGIRQPVTVRSNRGHLSDGYDRGLYSFEDVVLLGTHADVQYYDYGGGMHYFGGADATMSKRHLLYTYGYPAFFDAGWHGGLTLSGNWVVVANGTTDAVQKWIALTGSNAVPCVISGAFVESKFSGAYATDSYRTIFTQKLGSGTWRFSGNRSHGGGFAIEEGTLQFDSIAEKGVASSLGLSTNLTAACSVRDPTQVPYAFTLGSTQTDAPPAAFEFTGGKSCQSGSRPLVLVGSGGSLRASGTAGARLGFGGISAWDAGETTIVLDGTNKQSNVATGITDGNGIVSVVKDGDGEWYLCGTNTFSGDLHVKAGTLVVQGPKYTWFRFTVKELGTRGTNTLLLRQLALFDADGIRQNICLKVNEPKPWGNGRHRPDADWMALEPGTFAFGSSGFLCQYSGDYLGTYVDQAFSDVGNTKDGGITRFDGVTSYGKPCQMHLFDTSSGADTSVYRETPESWIPFVMRITNGAPEIVRYDIESHDNSARTNAWPKLATMEASVDGIHWDLVETNAAGAVVAEHEYDFSIPLNGASDTRNKWFSDGTAQVTWSEETGTTPRPGMGFPIRGHADMPEPLANVRSVQVDEDATLWTDAGVTINSLKVDASGAGTIDGFTFAPNGTLDVTFTGSLPSTTVLPGTYVNCAGVENIAKWALKVGGVPTDKYCINIADGKITLIRRGFTILFR